MPECGAARPPASSRTFAPIMPARILSPAARIPQHMNRNADLRNQGHCPEYLQCTASWPPLPGWFLASRKHKKNIKAEVTASSQ
jgi:hypothetical protein